MEQIVVTSSDKKDIYEEVLPQIASLLSSETNLIANMANTCAVLKEVFNWWWVGFYLVENEQELVLGPFQGPLACTRIAKGKGVCGTAWQQQKTILVPDVELFPGHIACSSASKSEIVLPLYIQNKIVAVFDIDSENIAHFDTTDQFYLEKILGFFDTK